MPAAPFKNRPLLTAEQLQQRLGELYEGVHQFNDGYYFESHETLEDLWMVTPLPERDLLQAIIQLAAGLVHYARGEYPGIVKLLDSAADKLRPFSPAALGVDVDGLLVDVKRVRAEIVALGPHRLADWDERHAPQIRLERLALPLQPA
jgi:predicted metal-dependent hydrolase